MKSVYERKDEIHKLINHVVEMDKTHSFYQEEFLKQVPEYISAFRVSMPLICNMQVLKLKFMKSLYHALYIKVNIILLFTLL